MARRTQSEQKAFMTEDDDSFKDDILDWMKHRDYLTLEALRTEGFCLATMPVFGAPAQARPDFTYYLPKLDGCPNLVVSAPAWTTEEVSELFRGIHQRQLAHGKTAQVIDTFDPAAENWFRFQTETVYIAGVALNPPYDGGVERTPWAHCASLKIQGAGTESRLRVVHIGLGPGRDPVFLNFLTPHGLVPRRLLL
jgi:hypothetical protein